MASLSNAYCDPFSSWGGHVISRPNTGAALYEQAADDDSCTQSSRPMKASASLTLEEAETIHILRVLEQVDWVVFQSLVQHMAQALRARYAFVTTCDDQKHARTLAFWKRDGFGENFEFDIADTPCKKVLHGEVCHYRQELQALFPRDKRLGDWQTESYLGVPMLDHSNRVIGHIAILDDKPMEADSRTVDLLKIFACRAAAELKRQKAENELQAALQEGERMREELAHLAHLNRVSTHGRARGLLGTRNQAADFSGDDRCQDLLTLVNSGSPGLGGGASCGFKSGQRRGPCLRNHWSDPVAV